MGWEEGEERTYQHKSTAWRTLCGMAKEPMNHRLYGKEKNARRGQFMKSFR